MKRFLSILLTVVMLVTMFTQTALAVGGGSTDQAETVVEEYTMDGEKYIVTTIRDYSRMYADENDNIAVIVDGPQRRVEFLRTGEMSYEYTITWKDEMGQLLQGSQEKHKGTFSYSPEASERYDDIAPYASYQGGSEYFTGDKWYWYENDEWHLYYDSKLVNTGANPGSSIVRMCKNYKDTIYDFDKFYGEFIKSEQALAGDLIPALGIMQSVADIYQDLENDEGFSVLKDIALGYISIHPLWSKVKTFYDASKLATNAGLVLAEHHNYYTIWKEVKKEM